MRIEYEEEPAPVYLFTAGSRVKLWKIVAAGYCLADVDAMVQRKVIRRVGEYYEVLQTIQGV